MSRAERRNPRAAKHVNVCKFMKFTLVELLIVIAIIAVLAAMLLPALNASRRSAQAIKCSSNQHQLGLAIVQYADSFNGEFVTYMPGGRVEDGFEKHYHFFLMKNRFLPSVYKSDNAIDKGAIPRSAAFCPASERFDGNFWSYGVIAPQENDAYDKAFNNCLEKVTGVGAVLRMYKAKNPSRFSYLYDSVYLSSDATNPSSIGKPGSRIYNGSVFPRIYTRHNRRVNSLFADGHVSSRTKAVYYYDIWSVAKDSWYKTWCVETY